MRHRSTHQRLLLAGTLCVWVIAATGCFLAWAGASAAVVVSLLGAAAFIATYLMWVAMAAEDENEADRKLAWARTLWESVAGGELPSRGPRESDAEFAERLFELSREQLARKEADAILAAELRRAIDALDLPVLAFDAEGMTVLGNTAAQQMYQLSETELQRRAVEELLTQRDAFELVQRAIAGTRGRQSIRILQRVLDVAAVPVPAEGGVTPSFAAVVSVRDITEMAQAAQLKTDFVASASHEIRTPLASIKAAAETLRDGAAEMPALRERFLKMIQTNTERLEELTRDLMDLSRFETPEVQPEWCELDLSIELQTLREVFEPVFAERTLKLEFDFGGVRIVRSDPRLLRAILQNLIDNASKFAKEKTTVVVRLRAVAVPGHADTLQLSVIDQGMGIPLSAQARIFERFYQVEVSRSGQQPRRGTGLGLAIVKHAAKALGGSVSVESVWQQGTTMSVELPNAVVLKDEG